MMRALCDSSLFGRIALLIAAAALSLACSSSDNEDDGGLCTPDDADGIIDEPANPILTVTDTGFAPSIITTQNSSNVTLTLKNEGTTPHSFVVECLDTPNHDGCPMQSCFPSEAKIDSVAPGDEVKVVFETPLVEGIYVFRSDLPADGDLKSGQFIIQ